MEPGIFGMMSSDEQDLEGPRGNLLRTPNEKMQKEVREMTQWKCSNCGYTFGADTVPDQCPSCHQACTFSDVTCYIPDCGGPKNIDRRLAGKKDGYGITKNE